MSSTWKCLSVGDFVSQCNWSQITLETSGRSLVQRQQSLGNWQCLTIRDFFALHNWSGKAGLTESIEVNPNVVPDFCLTLPTRQFWQCFSWSGAKSSPAPDKVDQIIEATEKTIAEVQDFSLNDLSQLF